MASRVKRKEEKGKRVGAWAASVSFTRGFVRKCPRRTVRKRSVREEGQRPGSGRQKEKSGDVALSTLMWRLATAKAVAMPAVAANCKVKRRSERDPGRGKTERRCPSFDRRTSRTHPRDSLFTAHKQNWSAVQGVVPPAP